MERVAREYTDVPSPKPVTSYRAPLNQIGWAQELATPAAKDMPTANNDTYYLSAIVTLDEPYIVTVPDTNDRYYVIDVFNMWQELEHYIGRRATGTKAGQFAIVPPGWSGQLPPDVKSLTMYNASDKMLVENPIQRFKVGTDTKGLTKGSDGSITIPIQAESPTGDAAANWLPAPKGDFYVILCLYQPSQEILSGAYQLPQVRKVN